LSFSWLCLESRRPPADEDVPVAPFDKPAGGRSQRGGGDSFSGAQAKAGMVPRASTVSLTTSVVSAFCSNGEDLAAAASEQDLLLTYMPYQHLAVSERLVISCQNGFVRVIIQPIGGLVWGKSGSGRSRT